MKYFFACIFVLMAYKGFAQQPPQEKSQNIYYYKIGYTEVATKDSADVIEIITEPDAGEKLYDVQQFYKDGSKYFVGKSSEVHPVRLSGQGVYYYRNGNKKLIGNYQFGWRNGDIYHYFENGRLQQVMGYSIKDSLNKQSGKVMYQDSLFKFAYDTTGKALVDNGKGHYIRHGGDYKAILEEGEIKGGRRIGEWTGYSPDKKLSFTEKYHNGNLTDGTSTDSAGNHYNYVQRIKSPGFSGGSQSLGKIIGQNVRYPAFSRENNHQGRVVIGFRIKEDGQADEFRILQSVDRYADAEALRVVKLNPLWSPGEYYGKKQSIYFTVPISFTLHGQ